MDQTWFVKPACGIIIWLALWSPSTANGSPTVANASGDPVRGANDVYGRSGVDPSALCGGPIRGGIGGMELGSPYASTIGRLKREAGYGFPGYTGGFGGMPGFGSAGGSAIATGNALMGTAQTNGNTLTDSFGNSRSLANGISSGYSPSSTSIANSNSQMMSPYAGYGRRKRDSPKDNSQSGVDPWTSNDGPMLGGAEGAGQLIANSDPFTVDRRKRTAGYRFPGYNGGFVNIPVYGSAGGSAIATGNALLGTVLTNGKTFTDAFGNSRSYANGVSSGNNPSSTSIANSNSQGTNPSADISRRKRQAPVAFPSSRGFADGLFTGYSPASISVAKSNSQGMIPYAGFSRANEIH